MDVGIVGSGNLGTALARRLKLAGHTVFLAEGRDAGRAAATAGTFGVGHLPTGELTRRSDVVALAVPWIAIPDMLVALGDISDVVLWDCTNPLKPDLSALEFGTTTSAGEKLQDLVPSARVVKGIPAFAELLHSDDPFIGGRPAPLFVAGDDEEAKARVSTLMSDLPASVVDAGPLFAARFIEPAMMLLVREAYVRGSGPRVGLTFIH